MLIQFEKPVSLYSDPDSRGKSKLIKKGIIAHKQVYLDSIESIEEVFDDKGKILKNKVMIKLHGEEPPFLARYSYWKLSEIREQRLITHNFKQIGFLRGIKNK